MFQICLDVGVNLDILRPSASRLRRAFSKLELLPQIVESREFAFRLQARWTSIAETVCWSTPSLMVGWSVLNGQIHSK